MADIVSKQTNWPAVILAFIVTVIAIAYVDSCNKRGNEAKQYAQMAKDKDDSTRMYKNKFGQAIFTRKEVEGTLQNMALLYSKDSLDHLAARFNTKINKIQSFEKVSSKTVTDVPLDSQKAVYYTTPSTDYTDKPCPKVKYMMGTFHSKFVTSTVRLGDSAYNRIQVVDSLELLTKREREGNLFHRRWFTSMNILGQNPDATYKIDASFRVADSKPVKWVIVGYGGIGYDPTKFTGLKHLGLQFGIGVGRILFRIR